MEDRDLQCIFAAEATPRKDQLLAAVWCRIGGADTARRLVLPWTGAAAVLSLLLAAGAGGLAVTGARSGRDEFPAFAVQAPLAPSTLIGARR